MKQLSDVKAAIRDIPDYPKPGIVFKDICPILKDSELLYTTIELLASNYKDNKPTKIVGIESRGFIFGTALAYKFGAGFIPIRKKGKLPGDTYEASYELEYGSAAIEIHKDAMTSNDKVVVIDDLLATGGTAAASAELIEDLHAKILGIDFVIELEFLKGREKLKNFPVNSLIKY